MKELDRSMVGIDTQLLIHAYRENHATPEEEANHAKASALIRTLIRNRIQICISAITVAEYLTGIPQDRHAARVNDLSETYLIATFNMRASVIAASMVAYAKTIVSGDRQVVMADTKIVASLLANNCRRFETMDEKLAKIAQHAGMQVNSVPVQLELPLVDSVSVKREIDAILERAGEGILSIHSDPPKSEPPRLGLRPPT